MKFILGSLVLLFAANGFGACKDFSGHYGWNTDGDLPVTLEVNQTGCEHIDFLLLAPTINFKDTRSIELNGVFATLKVDEYEKVDGLYKFEGDDLTFIENHQPTNNTAPYTDKGKYYFVDDKTLVSEFDRVRNHERSSFSFIYVRQ